MCYVRSKRCSAGCMIQTGPNPHQSAALPYGELLLLLMADANAGTSVPEEMQKESIDERYGFVWDEAQQEPLPTPRASLNTRGEHAGVHGRGKLHPLCLLRSCCCYGSQPAASKRHCTLLSSLAHEFWFLSRLDCFCNMCCSSQPKQLQDVRMWATSQQGETAQ